MHLNTGKTQVLCKQYDYTVHNIRHSKWEREIHVVPKTKPVATDDDVPELFLY